MHNITHTMCEMLHVRVYGRMHRCGRAVKSLFKTIANQFICPISRILLPDLIDYNSQCLVAVIGRLRKNEKKWNGCGDEDDAIELEWAHLNVVRIERTLKIYFFTIEYEEKK